MASPLQALVRCVVMDNFLRSAYSFLDDHSSNSSMNRSVILSNHFCSSSGFIPSAWSTAVANSSAVMFERRAISSEAFGGMQKPHSIHNASRSRRSSISVSSTTLVNSATVSMRLWSFEALNAALEALAHATYDKGYSPASPLQALVMWLVRKISLLHRCVLQLHNSPRRESSSSKIAFASIVIPSVQHCA